MHLQFACAFAVVAIASAGNMDHGTYDFKVDHHYEAPAHHHHTEVHASEGYGAESYHGNSDHVTAYGHEGLEGHGHESYAAEGHAEEGGHGGDAGHEDHGSEDHHVDYFAHPAYKYEYGVQDEKTGDHKSAWEHRDGDKVQGEYTVQEADGTHRIVSYTSDKHNGFNAVVKKVGHASHHH